MVGRVAVARLRRVRALIREVRLHGGLGVQGWLTGCRRCWHSTQNQRNRADLLATCHTPGILNTIDGLVISHQEAMMESYESGLMVSSMHGHDRHLYNGTLSAICCLTLS